MPGAFLEVHIDKISATPARESDLEVKIVKAWQVRSTFGSSASQNLHHACARERFGSQNRKKRFLRFKVCFAWQAQGFRQVAKYVAGAGVREGCKKRWQAWGI